MRECMRQARQVVCEIKMKPRGFRAKKEEKERLDSTIHERTNSVCIFVFGPFTS